MSGSKMFSLVLLLVALMAGASSIYTVKEMEKVIVLRFGKLISTDAVPGLHFKMPFFDEVRKFDGRLATLDADPVRYLTKEQKYVNVDSYAQWRIVDLKSYYLTTAGGDEMRARDLIQKRVSEALRNEFGNRTIQEVVSGERTEIMNILTEKMNEGVAELGVEITDVRIKRIDLPEDVSEQVFHRMRSERERVSRDLRARGQEEAEKIRADADRQRTVILAEAYRDAEILRGEGDAKAAAIYANAYEKDAEFFKFTRSLTAYRKTLADQHNLMILEPDTDFFNYFTDIDGK